jgi:hypothetical protein
MNKLIIIQTQLKAPKNQRNNFGNYNYRSAEDILEAVKPLLAEHNCLLYLSDEIITVNNRNYVKATATFMDGNFTLSVSASAREEESKKGMDGSQVTGASSSYARKYALNGLFLIDDTKDSDYTNTHDEAKKQPKKPTLNRDTPTYNQWVEWWVKNEALTNVQKEAKVREKFEVSFMDMNNLITDANALKNLKK